MKIVPVLIAALVFCSCSTLSFRDISSLKKQLDIAELPAQSDYPGSAAVIIMDRTDVNTVVDTNYNYHTTVTVHCVKKIFDDLSKESRIDLTLQPGQALLDIKARTIRPNGKVIALKEKEFHAIYGGPLTGSFFHSDVGRISFTFPSVVSGSIVEYAYRFKDEMPFPAGEWVVQRNVPTMRSIYSLSIPSFMIGNSEKDERDWQWNFVTYDYPDIGNPSISRRYGSGDGQVLWHDLAGYTLHGAGRSREVDMSGDGTTDVFTWTLDDVPAFKAEPEMPPKDWYRGYVQFAPVDWETWNDVSTWYYNDVLKSRLVITDKLQRESARLTKGASTELDTLNRIFRFVQEIPYSENKKQLGELKPEYPAQVLANHEGDCRGKAMLLVTLLRAAGISAKPAVIVTRSNGRLDTSFPCWRFHRMIVGALISDNRIVWLDPAAQYCMPGEVPPEDEAAIALVMNADGSSFLMAPPASEAWSNTIYMDIHAVEHLTAPADFQVVLKYGGEAGVEMRNRLAGDSQPKIRDYCEAMTANAFAEPKLGKFRVSPPGASGEYYTLSFDFTARNLVRQDSSEYFLYVDPFPSVENFSWIVGSVRYYPVEFRYPYVMNKRIDVTFDSSLFLLKTLPEGINEEIPDFDYSSSYSAGKPLQVMFREVFISRKRMLQPEDYQKAVSFFGKISETKGKPVILVKR